MKKWNYKDLKKGMGIIVKIPGDEHNGKQNKRPGIVINTEPKYATVQLLSSQSSNYDFASFVINNKMQYVRTIYLKNIPLNQIEKKWKNNNKKKPIQLDTEGKIMKAIENNQYKASSITLSLDHYLNLINTIELLQNENQVLRQERTQAKNNDKESEYQTLNMQN